MKMKPVTSLVGILPIACGLAATGLIVYGQQTGAQRTATAIAVVRDGSVTEIELTDKGTGYPVVGFEQNVSGGVPPYIYYQRWKGDVKVKITGGGGSGAEAVAQANPIFNNETSLTKVYVHSGGKGYISAPKVEIESPAEAIARLESEIRSAKEQESAGKRADAEADHQKVIQDRRDLMRAIFGTLPVTLSIIFLCIGIVGLAVYMKKSKRLSQFAAMNLNSKYVAAAAAVVACCLTLAVMKHQQLGPWGKAIPVNSASPSSDPDPTGTWTAGDRDSVYTRLVVRPSGSFSFQTVDFTGDVKGGYSGSWTMNGKSIRFEWGGLADGGSCSGQKIGQNTLIFGSTTFSK